MKYERIAARLYDVPLLCTLERAEQIARVLRARMIGEILDGEDAVAALLRPPREEAVLSALAGQGFVARREGYAVDTDSGVAILPVYGSLVQRGGSMDALSGFTGYNMLAAQLAATMADPDVRGVVLDIDSPGGEVAGAFEMAAAIRGAAKPVWAVANEQAASAAYLIGSAAQRLYTPRTGTVGSVGVVMLHADRSRQFEKAGITYTPIFAGARKLEGSSLGPLSAQGRKAAQDRVDQVYGLFVDHVEEQRGISAQAVRDTEAAMLMADEAESIGFIDGVATLGDVIGELAESLDSGSGTSQPRRASVGATSITERAETMNAPKEIGAQPLQPAATTPAAAPAAATPAPAAAPDAELQAAVQRASDDQRARMRAILTHEEARGREGLAQHFAYDTTMSVDAAVAAMKASPRAEAKANAPANLLAAAMSSPDNANPDVGAAGGANDSDDAKAAASVIRFLPNQAKR